MKNLVSFYQDDIFYDGVIIKYTNFCKEHMASERCKSFYTNFERDCEDEKICPYGFLCKKCDNRVYNGIISKEKCNLSKLKPKIDRGSKVYSDSEIFNLINNDEELLFYEVENKLSNDCINDFLHDVNKSNSLIAENLNVISKDNLTKKDKNRLISSIKLTDFFNKRVELYRIVSNPMLIQTGRLRKRDAFGLFDLYRKTFEEIGKKNNITIVVSNIDLNKNENSEFTTTFMANDSITVLPFLLIDNALKYSKNGSTINIKIYQLGGFAKKIIVANNPSYIVSEDLSKFFIRGYRSVQNTSKSSGSGLGLSIVKQICDYNNIDVDLNIDVDSNGLQLFEVVMNIRGD